MFRVRVACRIAIAREEHVTADHAHERRRVDMERACLAEAVQRSAQLINRQMEIPVVSRVARLPTLRAPRPRPAARAASVVLPARPFWFSTAMTLPTRAVCPPCLSGKAAFAALDFSTAFLGQHRFARASYSFMHPFRCSRRSEAVAGRGFPAGRRGPSTEGPAGDPPSSSTPIPQLFQQKL
jgi:hypothetical protein